MAKQLNTKRLKKWPKSGKQPIAFMFQPTHYEIVPSERLKEWEELMVKRVGFPRDLVRKMAAQNGGTETISIEFPESGSTMD